MVTFEEALHIQSRIQTEWQAKASVAKKPLTPIATRYEDVREIILVCSHIQAEIEFMSRIEGYEQCARELEAIPLLKFWLDYCDRLSGHGAPEVASRMISHQRKLLGYKGSNGGFGTEQGFVHAYKDWLGIPHQPGRKATVVKTDAERQIPTEGPQEIKEVKEETKTEPRKASKAKYIQRYANIANGYIEVMHRDGEGNTESAGVIPVMTKKECETLHAVLNALNGQQ